MNPQQHSSGELVLDSEQLGRIIHTYQGNHRMAASHADQLLGLASGPGARFRAAVEVANARLPRVLYSQPSQWERLCGDILLFRTPPGRTITPPQRFFLPLSLHRRSHHDGSGGTVSDG